MLGKANWESKKFGVNKFEKWLKELSTNHLSTEFICFLEKQAVYYQSKNKKYANYLYQLIEQSENYE